MAMKFKIVDKNTKKEFLVDETLVDEEEVTEEETPTEDAKDELTAEEIKRVKDFLDKFDDETIEKILEAFGNKEDEAEGEEPVEEPAEDLEGAEGEGEEPTEEEIGDEDEIIEEDDEDEVTEDSKTCGDSKKSFGAIETNDAVVEETQNEDRRKKWQDYYDNLLNN